jgi:hypothetical protein
LGITTRKGKIDPKKRKKRKKSAKSRSKAEWEFIFFWTFSLYIIIINYSSIYYYCTKPAHHPLIIHTNLKSQVQSDKKSIFIFNLINFIINMS